MQAPIYALVGLASGASLSIRDRRRRRVAERLAAATLESLLYAIDANDEDTGRHVRRVARYALALADAVGLEDADRSAVERIALFHDIGKIHEALFDVVHDADTATAAERRAILTHPTRGAQVLAPLAPFFPELPTAVLAHHERWDGTGYPRGLAGKNIPFLARIVTIADTFDVVSHGRPYRSAAGANAAFEIILIGRGAQFDPQLVDLLLLPPVRREFSRLASSTTALGPPRRAPRPSGRVSPRAPDVPIRWRSETLRTTRR